MKTTTVCLLLAACAAHTSTAEADRAALMRGKTKTDRTIFLEASVQAPPAEVFRLWTSRDGVKKFFAPEARIDASAGGRYQTFA